MIDREKVMGDLTALAMFLKEKNDPISLLQANICTDALELLKEQTPEMPAQLAHDLETVAKVRAGKIAKAQNSAYVIWSRDFYEREMERLFKVLGAVPGAGHSERDPEGVQRERTEPDGP